MSQESERIDAQAAKYLARAHEESQEERLEREHWLASDRRHVQAYQRMQEIEQRLIGQKDDPELRMQMERDLLALRKSRQRRWALLLVVVSVLIAVLILSQFF